MDNSWIHDSVGLALWKRHFLGVLFYLFLVNYIGTYSCIPRWNFTMLFVYYLKSFNKWECAFTEKMISMSLLRFLIINFEIILWSRTYINLKSNGQRSLNYLNRMGHTSFNFLPSNVKRIQSSKMRLKQFEYFKNKLKPSGLLFLQEMHSNIDLEKT